MAERKFKLDIFELLNKINSSKSGDIYAALSEDEQKGFAPLVVMRWMSGTSDERQIMLLNEFANPYVFSLGHHPHLLLQLLQVSSSKTPKRYQWLGVKGSKKNAMATRVVSEFFGMSEREVRLLSPFPPKEEIFAMAEDIGWQKNDIALLQKEFKE